MIVFLCIYASSHILLCLVLTLTITDCSSDEYCQQTLLSLVEIVPINSFVSHVVTTILSTCVKLSQKVGDSTSSMSGTSDFEL